MLIIITIPSGLRIPTYGDDMLVVRPSIKEIVNLKAKLVKEFSMKDLGPAKKILRMKINRERKEIAKSVRSRVREEGAEEV